MSRRAAPTIEPAVDPSDPTAELGPVATDDAGDRELEDGGHVEVDLEDGELEDRELEDRELEDGELVEYGPIATTELRVDESTVHGTGVFAERAYEPDEIIERCPVLVLDTQEAWAIADTALGDYVYEWEGGCAVALGFGSLYNHSRTSNARYEMDYDLVEIDVVAVRPIAPGDEIFINYNGDPTITDPVWFETE